MGIHLLDQLMDVSLTLRLSSYELAVDKQIYYL